MVENLKTTKYSDGTEIPLVTDIIVWGNLTSPAYSLYGYIPDVPNIYKATYGALYNWYVVDSASSSGKNVCPAGWHVPNDVEWATLVTYLGGESIAGGKLKEAGTNHWTSPNTGATNESGFTALPGGGYYYYGSLYFTVSSGRWWSATSYHATEAKSFIMSYNTIVAYNRSFQKQSDFHIRCLKN